MLLIDENGNEVGLPNETYLLNDHEVEQMLAEVGFNFKKIKLNTEKAFDVWLCQK